MKTHAEAQRESERLKAENTALERDVVDLARLVGCVCVYIYIYTGGYLHYGPLLGPRNCTAPPKP